MELRLPPLLLMFLFALMMWLISVSFPKYSLQLLFHELIGSFLILLGVIIAATGVMAFRRSNTTVDPRYPDHTQRLVITGIYRVTRNPMYLGFLFILLGWACLLLNGISLAVLPLFVIYINQFQIKPEEKALRKLFGNDYRRYCQSVRRWL